MFKKIIAIFVLVFSFHLSFGEVTPPIVVDATREGKFGLMVMAGSLMSVDEFNSLSSAEKKEIQKRIKSKEFITILSTSLSKAMSVMSNDYDLKSIINVYVIPNKPNISVVSIKLPTMDMIMTTNISNDLKVHMIAGFVIEEDNLKSNLSDPIYQNMLKKYNISLTEKDIKNLTEVK